MFTNRNEQCYFVSHALQKLQYVFQIKKNFGQHLHLCMNYPLDFFQISPGQYLK